VEQTANYQLLTATAPAIVIATVNYQLVTATATVTVNYAATCY